MKRFQAIEFEDFHWFPQTLRNFMTDFYHSQMISFNLYYPATDLLADVLKKTAYLNIIDLCSGGSGPHLLLQQQLQSEHQLDINTTLTDKFPNVPAFEKIFTASDGKITFSSASVDATDVPESLQGVRTLFSSFHHFPPALAMGILQDAVAKKSPIAIFELSNRSLSNFLQSLIGAPLGLAFATPTLKPFTLLRLLFTYLIPIIPLLVMWDGVASNLRAYSPDEMQQLVGAVSLHESFEWKTGIAKGPVLGIKVTYLIGLPKTV